MAKKVVTKSANPTPTPTCYQATADTLVNLATPQNDLLRRFVGMKGLDLVHGQTKHGDYAWLESNDMVFIIEPAGYPMAVWPKDKAYESLGIKPKSCKRYTRADVLQKLNDTKHHGPWK